MNHFSLQQSDTWKSFQKSIGREVFEIEENKKTIFIIKIPLKKDYCWFLIQKAFFNDYSDTRSCVSTKLWEKIQILAKKENAIFIRFENCNVNIKNVETGRDLSLRKAHQTYLPETTLIIDLKQSENDILAQMKQKGRYNIRLAEKKGIKIEKYDFHTDLVTLKEKIKSFHNILKETSSRDGFHCNSEEFYLQMILELGNHAKLYTASYNSEMLAGIIVTSYGNTTTYYYGASGNIHRELMAPYLLQWTAIKDAKAEGFEIYDFLGIAPDNVKNHPLQKVTNFKLKFGGQIINYEASQEYIFKPFFYTVFVLGKYLLKILKKLI